MGRCALAWALVTPVAAAGVLAMHALAYVLTGTEPGPAHDYLAHGPQVIGLLASLGLLGLALQERSLSPGSAWWFAPLAPLGFLCQEHVERIAHGEGLPWLLASPTMLIGLVLQVPVGLLCVLLVRRVVGALVGARRSGLGVRPDAWLPLSDRPVTAPATVRAPRPAGRGPPTLLVA